MAGTNNKPITTELQLQRLKPSTKQFDVAVAIAPGLVVRVGVSGKKTFRWDRGRGQKPRIITYGQSPELSLKQARDAHEKVRQQFKDGAIGQLEAGTPKTITELAELFYKDRIVPVRKRPEIVRQVLDHDILPVIGSMRITSVSTMIVRQVVKKVVDRGATVHAGRVLAIMKQLLGFGATLGVLEYNTALPLKKIDLGIEDNQSDRTLSHDEIKLFWNALNTTPRLSIQTKTALKLLLILGIRSGELRLAKWVDIDAENGLLTIPVSNQKLSPRQVNRAKPFSVPLDGFAIELFKEVRGLNNVWVFPGFSGEGPINEKALGKVVRRLLGKGQDSEPVLPIERFTPHDLRRTMRSNLSRLGIQPHIAERCLNHSLGAIIGIYDQHDYLEERKEALARWSQQVQIILGEKDNGVLMEESA